jgi:hypothetical protein
MVKKRLAKSPKHKMVASKSPAKKNKKSPAKKSPKKSVKKSPKKSVKKSPKKSVKKSPKKRLRDLSLIQHELKTNTYRPKSPVKKATKITGRRTVTCSVCGKTEHNKRYHKELKN